MWKSLHHPVKCTGCLQCEMACSYEHTGVINPAKSRIRSSISNTRAQSAPPAQCTEAWCLNACRSTPFRVDLATGAKIVLDDVCVGCKVCLIACPFGTINLATRTPARSEVRPLRGNPACATACPTGAITYVDADWTGLDRMRQWATAKANTAVAAE